LSIWWLLVVVVGAVATQAVEALVGIEQEHLA
jgi:hypothetical protein